MYVYDEIDQRLVDERVAQFRDQTRRFLAGELTEDEFRPLRLQNGLYIQRYAPMLRIAIPYGLLSSPAAAHARAHRAHVRPRLRPLHHAPEPAVQLAEARGRARHPRRARDGRRCTRSRPRGNCVRNITTDHFAGVAPDEIVDPLVWCEIDAAVVDVPPRVRLPAAQVQDRGERRRRATAPRSCVHDIGLHARARRRTARSASACSSAAAWAARRSIGHVIREFLPWQHLLTYLDAILRVYNRYGRRDNNYKARIKILVKERTPEEFRDEVEAEWAHAEGRPGDADRARRSSASRRASRAPRTSSSRRLTTRLRARARPTTARSRAGRSATCIRTRCRATRRSRCRSRRPACRRATRPPTRWTRSPTSPTATASASCASRTSRT